MSRSKTNVRIDTKAQDGTSNGFLVPIFNVHDGFLAEAQFPKQVYLTVVAPKSVKGPHLHLKRWGLFTCIRGNVKIISRSERGYEEAFSGEKHCFATVRFQPGPIGTRESGSGGRRSEHALAVLAQRRSRRSPGVVRRHRPAVKVLLSEEWYSDIYAEPFYQRFKELGVQVIAFKEAKYFSKGRRPGQPKGVEDLVRLVQWRLRWGPLLKRLNDDLLATVAREQPDAVFLFRGLQYISQHASAAENARGSHSRLEQ